MNEEQENPSYFLDLAWYEEQGRSFTTLVGSRLCPSCRAKYAQMEGHRPSDVLSLVRDCSAHSPDFISPDRPIMELVFRLFLISGTQSLGLAEIQRRLQEKLGSLGLPRDLSLRMLKRLVGHDRYYGLRPVPGPKG